MFQWCLKTGNEWIYLLIIFMSHDRNGWILFTFLICLHHRHNMFFLSFKICLHFLFLLQTECSLNGIYSNCDWNLKMAINQIVSFNGLIFQNFSDSKWLIKWLHCSYASIPPYVYQIMAGVKSELLIRNLKTLTYMCL